MNDRFKFRFYDKQCKMYLADGHYINGDKWLDDYYEDVYDLPEYIIPEQCTGLKDKNGNLIYEGDIVNYCGEINTVVFDACGFKFKDNEGLCIEPFRTDVEIIGNIHETERKEDANNQDK